MTTTSILRELVRQDSQGKYVDSDDEDIEQIDHKAYYMNFEYKEETYD